jgi:hypothetical protein
MQDYENVFAAITERRALGKVVLQMTPAAASSSA